MTPHPAETPEHVTGVTADLRSHAGSTPLHGLRVLLTADVVCRAVALFGAGQPQFTVITGDGGMPSDRLRDVLQIRTPDHRRADELHDTGGTLVCAVAGDAPTPRPPSRLLIEVAPVSDHAGLVARTADGPDPLSLRLAFLHTAPGTPLMLSPARLHRASETLRRWQQKIADWHDMEPTPWPSDRIEPLRAVLSDSADAAAVITELHRIEFDLHLASHTKYSIFTDLDRVLGLNLTRFVGKRRRW